MSPALRPTPPARPANDGTIAKKTAEDTNEEHNTPSDDIKASLSAVVTEGPSSEDEGKPVADKKPAVAAHPDDPKTDLSAHSDQVTTANAGAGLIAVPRRCRRGRHRGVALIRPNPAASRFVVITEWPSFISVTGC
jgi:hypothetical protein